MIDIHTHILPNVDDGAKSLDISLKLIEQEIKNGVNKIVLTPHMNEMMKDKDDILKAYEMLKKEAPDGVELLLGAEIKYYDKMISDLNEGKLLTMNNSKYVLVEFDYMNDEHILDAIYELQIAGYKPIIAHIERYNYLTKKDYVAIKETGTLVQVNASSINRSNYKKRVKYLIKKGLVDFIASDCHNLEHRGVDFTDIKKAVMKYNKKDYDRLFSGKIEFRKKI